MRTIIVITSCAALLAAVTGCGAASSATNVSSTSSTSSADSGTVSVVASTDVYGDIVTALAGDLAGTTVKVTSIISDPDADPHSYEADTRNQLALSRADLVIENGGGYDDFIDTMLTGVHPAPTVLNAVELSGHQPVDGELNEHVWYDFPTVATVAGKIVTALSKADPKDASTYAANGKAFEGQLQAMEQTEATIKASYAGDGVAITEPVPLYLLQACGLDNKTPSDFSEAIEEGSDVAPAILQQTLELFSGHQVKLLAYNEQTSGPETTRVLDAAKGAGVAVVPVTETLPQGKDYLSWMQSNLAAVKSALAGAA